MGCKVGTINACSHARMNAVKENTESPELKIDSRLGCWVWFLVRIASLASVLYGLLSWASSIATTRIKRPAQVMSTSIRIPIHSLSTRRWVAIAGVKEMIEMSKTPGEYKYPLTPLGSWQPSWL